MNILNDPLGQQIASGQTIDQHNLVHGLSQQNMNNLQVGGSPVNNQLTQMSTQFRNNLKNITSTPLNQQQGLPIAQSHNEGPNSISPLTNNINSTLHTQLAAQHQLQHQLAQHQQFQHSLHHQHRSQIHEKQLLALAAQNTLPDLPVKGSFNRSNSSNNGNNNLYNKQSQFNNSVNGEINNLPELSSFLHYSNNQNLPYAAMAQFQNQLSNSSNIGEISSSFFQNSHQQMLQNSTPPNQNSNFLSTPQIQIKQQPHTPVPSPIPLPVTQYSQHSSDLLTNVQNDNNTRSDLSEAANNNHSQTLVNALTAAINNATSNKISNSSNSKIPPRNEILINESSSITNNISSPNDTSERGDGVPNSSNIADLNNSTSTTRNNIDQHLSDTSLNEVSESTLPIVFNNKSSDLLNKFSSAANSLSLTLPTSPVNLSNNSTSETNYAAARPLSVNSNSSSQHTSPKHITNYTQRNLLQQFQKNKSPNISLPVTGANPNTYATNSNLNSTQKFSSSISNPNSAEIESVLKKNNIFLETDNDDSPENQFLAQQKIPQRTNSPILPTTPTSASNLSIQINNKTPRESSIHTISPINSSNKRARLHLNGEDNNIYNGWVVSNSNS